MKTLIIVNILATLCVGVIAFSANVNAYNALKVLTFILEAAPAPGEPS